ncbi:GAF domain-containing sensor histidine kinase [Desulfobacula sp.]|uniref:GAF domain-containing sensor histidine kinase n=1 Tax=Desulfobacula sp. TaxID=2593537 RepID=UPI00261EB39C|nr:GAF domain-containing sensor histidine kinase [Desulfobacula sp.]
MAEKLTYKELVQRVEALEQQLFVLNQKEVSLRESERKIAKNNEAILRISMALPEYPDLEDLLDYISSEIKRLLDAQGALVILLDEEKKTFFFLGAAYDDTATKKRVKRIRFPIKDLASGNVIKTGEPIIVNDSSRDVDLYPERDKKFGFHFRNYVLVPLKSSDRMIGVLAAFNKTRGGFEQSDVELLGMIAGTVSLSIENARFSEELKTAYRELTSLDRAKDKAINHLSHELKTPVSIFSGTLSVLAKKLEALPEKTWKQSMNRAQRNLGRVRQIQDEVNDIIQGKQDKTYHFFSFIVDQCSDLLSTIIEDEMGETPVIEIVRNRIKEIFDTREMVPEKILLDDYVKERLETLAPLFIHRQVEINPHLHSTLSLYIPKDPLQKIVDGLIRNAVENTPDHGKIDVIVRNHEEEGVELVVMDYGVGITPDHQKRIFEGFFTTQDTANYSSKNPFDFNAGGRGADLLRMKIFSERYHFKIHMTSSRCRFIPDKKDLCPGDIHACPFCKNKEACHHSGGSSFSLIFPAIS